MPVFDLYLFDLDGTLVDTREDITASVNYVMSLHSRSAVEATTVVSWIGNGLDDLMKKAFQTDDVEFISQLVEEFRDHYAEHCTDASYLYEGCSDTLLSLRRSGAHLSILTNKPQDLSVEIVRRLGILEHFDHVVGPLDADLRKPNPSNLLSLMRDVGALAQRTLMVGDSRNDILVARNAGVPSCGCTFGYYGRERLAEMGPTYLIDQLPDLTWINPAQD